jgi:hypothetical protein
MTERDQAALAIAAGLCANAEIATWGEHHAGIASRAYAIADALAAEANRVCPVCGATRKPGGSMLHASGCTFGWPVE